MSGQEKVKPCCERRTRGHQLTKLVTVALVSYYVVLLIAPATFLDKPCGDCDTVQIMCSQIRDCGERSFWIHVSSIGRKDRVRLLPYVVPFWKSALDRLGVLIQLLGVEILRAWCGMYTRQYEKFIIFFGNLLRVYWPPNLRDNSPSVGPQLYLWATTYFGSVLLRPSHNIWTACSVYGAGPRHLVCMPSSVSSQKPIPK
jgi:hypothetical protein